MCFDLITNIIIQTTIKVGQLDHLCPISIQLDHILLVHDNATLIVVAKRYVHNSMTHNSKCMYNTVQDYK